MTAAALPLTETFVADRDHSSFHAQLRHMGVGTFRTSFEDVDARLEPLAGGGHRLTGSARADSITIRRPAEFRAHVLEGEEFFDANHHPELRFVSEAVELRDDGTAEVSGLLTMRGVERPVTATGTFAGPREDIYGAPRAALVLGATIDRRDWGFSFQAQIPGGGDVLSWEVELSIHLELVAT